MSLGLLIETERCPNCGSVFHKGHCTYTATVRKSWGSSTLYDVCEGCARRHDAMNEPPASTEEEE